MTDKHRHIKKHISRWAKRGLPSHGLPPSHGVPPSHGSLPSHGLPSCRLAAFCLLLLSVVLAGCTNNNFLQPQKNLRMEMRRVVMQAELARPLNSLIYFDAAGLQAEAARLDKISPAERTAMPLFGIPYIAKDNIDTATMPTSGGTEALRGLTPARSAPVIDQLQAAGAVLAGKANLHELAYGITSNNAAFGAVRNPYNPRHIAGGSSGGTAAAIAAGIVEVGLGTDTGGSMRVPAALCGVYGFRPTIGRYNGQGLITISHTRDTVGVMAHSVDLIARFDAVLSGEAQDNAAPSADKLRIGIPQRYFHDNLHPDVQRHFNRIMTELQAAGITLVRADINDIAALNEKVSFPIVLYETAQDLPAYLMHRKQADFAAVLAGVKSPDVAAILQNITGDGAIPQAAYEAALIRHRPALQMAYRQYFARYRVDAILVMTTPLPAAEIGADETVMLNGKPVPTFATFIRNTDPPSNAGLPAISVPVGLSADGLPIGAELVGTWHSDRRLLQIADIISRIVMPQMPPPDAAKWPSMARQ